MRETVLRLLSAAVFVCIFKFFEKCIPVKTGSLEEIPVIAAGLWVIHSPSPGVCVSVSTITMLGYF